MRVRETKAVGIQGQVSNKEGARQRRRSEDLQRIILEALAEYCLAQAREENT